LTLSEPGFSRISQIILDSGLQDCDDVIDRCTLKIDYVGACLYGRPRRNVANEMMMVYVQNPPKQAVFDLFYSKSRYRACLQAVARRAKA